MPLTDTRIKTAKPTEKVYKLYDAEGLCVMVSLKKSGARVIPFPMSAKNGSPNIVHHGLQAMRRRYAFVSKNMYTL